MRFDATLRADITTEIKRGDALDQTLFNWHDLVLFVTAFECLIIGLFVVTNTRFHKPVLLILGGVFGAHALVSINELITWGVSFRLWVLEYLPSFFFTLEFALYMEGPLFLWFSAKLTQRSVTLRPLNFFHLLPCALFVIYIGLSFWSKASVQKQILIENFELVSSWHFISVGLVGRLIRFFYFVWAAKLILDHLNNKPYREVYRKINICLWIASGVVGWDVFLSSMKVVGLFTGIPTEVFQFIGLAGYYGAWGAITYSALILVLILTLPTQKKATQVSHGEPDPEHVAKLKFAMQHDKLFVNPNLTVDRLAEKLEMPAKELSQTVNRYFDQTFIEFINGYRIEYAKQLLQDPEQSHKRITDIFLESGFNSKSVYNTLFKKKFGVTPSQLRKKSSVAP